MKQRKVLHLTFDMRIGGTEQVIKSLIDGADTDLFEHAIFCIEAPLGPFGEALHQKGVQIHTEVRQKGFDKGLPLRIRKYIKKHQIDILHCHQYTPWVYGTMAAMFTRTKVVFTEHGRFYPDSSSWKRQLINPVLNMFTDQVVAISKATQNALVNYENFPRICIDVIYNGIAELTINPTTVAKHKAACQIDESHVVLGTIARFDPIKNHKMMIKAFAEVVKTYPKAILLIVGDGDERSNIESLITELNLAENVILIGYDPQPQHYLAMMDIYLLSSFSEGTSMTLLEAMSIGKPCVVTDAGGNAEIIHHNLNGVVTGNDNLAQFVQGCLQLIADSQQRDKYGEQGRNIFAQKFSLKAMVSDYQKYYTKL